MLLAECTVGAGGQIGSRFEELHVIREYASKMTDLPVRFCLDTCHLLASGYDVATEAGFEENRRRGGSVLGLEQCPRHSCQRFEGPSSARTSTGMRILAKVTLDGKASAAF